MWHESSQFQTDNYEIIKCLPKKYCKNVETLFFFEKAININTTKNTKRYARQLSEAAGTQTWKPS